MGKNYHLVIKSFLVIVHTKNKLGEHFDQFLESCIFRFYDAHLILFYRTVSPVDTQALPRF